LSKILKGPPKIYSLKTRKIWRNFGQLQTLADKYMIYCDSSTFRGKIQWTVVH